MYVKNVRKNLTYPQVLIFMEMLIFMKCIKEKCIYYFSSDIYETCKLVDEYCVACNCIGYDKIDSKMEEIVCKISKLTNEYNTLAELKKYIIDN